MYETKSHAFYKVGGIISTCKSPIKSPVTVLLSVMMMNRFGVPKNSCSTFLIPNWLGKNSKA